MLDEAQARQLLGLDDGPITMADLRMARNHALKAHHPDKAGTDPAAVRRSTYWTSQINAAYTLLERGISGPKRDESPPDRANDPQSQSFASAAKRASERAAEKERAEAAAQARREQEEAKERAAAQAKAEAERVAREKAAAQERVAAQERADAAAGRRGAGVAVGERIRVRATREGFVDAVGHVVELTDDGFGLELDVEMPNYRVGMVVPIRWENGGVIERDHLPEPSVGRNGSDRKPSSGPPLIRLWALAIPVGLVVGLVGVGLANGWSLDDLVTPTPTPPGLIAFGTPGPTPRSTPTPTPTPIPGVTGQAAPQTVRQASTFFDFWKTGQEPAIAACLRGLATCDLDAEQAYDDGSTYVLSSEIPRVASLFQDNESVSFGDETTCREERGSIYELFVGMATEIELAKNLKADEAPPPTTWRPAASASWEACSSRSATDRQALAEDLRTDDLPNLRKTLVEVKKQLRAKDAEALTTSAGSLSDLAGEVARKSVRDAPDGGNPVWSSISQIAWDAERVSGAIGVPRLAAAKETATQVDSLLTRIDQIDLTKPLP